MSDELAAAAVTPPESLDGVPAAVESVLDVFFDRAVPAAAGIDPVVGTAAGVLREFVMTGGKRVRPVLAYAGWLVATSTTEATVTDSDSPGESRVVNASDALRVAAALELIQACALIHDDIIDHSDTRRGNPTVHRRLEAEHREQGWSGVAADHGVASAILIGDLALSWADDLVHGAGPAAAATGGAGAPLPSAVASVWAAMRTEVLGGQILDIVNESRGDESVEAAYRVMRFKTAAYTVARPLELGAALGGASAETVEQLRSAGNDLGISFQLRDDLLGVFGDPETTGKPSGDDLVAGKRTALIAVGLQRADGRDDDSADVLRDHFGRKLSDAEVARARAVLTDVGAVAEIERQIEDLLSNSLALIDRLQTTAAVRADLGAYARRLGHRQK